MPFRRGRKGGKSQQDVPAKESPALPEGEGDLDSVFGEGTTSSSPQQEADPTLVKLATRKAARVLVPLFFFAVLVGYMDRAALATTAPALINALSITDLEYGIASGIFYVGYVIMQYPSILIVDLLGVRLWYGTILVLWGVTTILTAFVETAAQLIFARFLLGAAEAGVSIIAYVYLDRFLMPTQVTQVWSSAVLVAIQLANITMGPASALILHSLAGSEGLLAYQWVYIIMGCLALVVGAAVYVFMIPPPEDCKLFTRDERAALLMAKSQLTKASTLSETEQTMAALSTWKSWYLGLAGFLHSAYLTMLQLYLPLLILAITVNIPTLNSTQAQIYSVFLTTIPYILGCLFLIFFGESASWLQHLTHPKLLTGVIAFATATALAGTYALEDPEHTTAVFLHLTVLGGLVIGLQSPLDTLPADYLQEEGVPRCFAIYNTMKNIGAAVGPVIMGGLLEQYSTEEASSILGLGCLLPLTIIYGLFFVFVDRSNRDKQKGPLGPAATQDSSPA